MTLPSLLWRRVHHVNRELSHYFMGAEHKERYDELVDAKQVLASRHDLTENEAAQSEMYVEIVLDGLQGDINQARKMQVWTLDTIERLKPKPPQ